MKKKKYSDIGWCRLYRDSGCRFFLKKKYKVTCIDNLLYGQKSTLKSFKENKNFIFLNIDLRDEKN